jgi:hypothetical protein
MEKNVHLLLAEDVLTIAPSNSLVEKYLTIDEKSLEPNPHKPWEKVVRYRKKQIFEVIKEEPRTVQTMPGFWYGLKKELEDAGYTVVFHDMRAAFPAPRLDLMRGFRFRQQHLLEKFLSVGHSGLLGAPTRYGKCLKPSTLVMMSDGSSREIQYVKEGEYVMGPDSQPRKVIGCVTGYDTMYRIIPNHGDMVWECNEGHLLHVERTSTNKRGKNAKWDRGGTRENIPVEQYYNACRWYKHIRKMRRVALEFPTKKLPIKPYIYGVWLGDGHSTGVAFTNMDHEIWTEINFWSRKNRLLPGQYTDAGKAHTQYYNIDIRFPDYGQGSLRSWFRERPKHSGIDEDYLTGDRQQRLELLAGLIDTDGEVNNKTNYGFISKHKKLSEDVVQLCRGLGFGASCKACVKKSQNGTTGTYYRVGIRGPVDQIPVRVARKKCTRKNKFNCLRVGFKVEKLGKGKFCGFTVDHPDGLFLLADCTVVHNTVLIINTLRAYSGLTAVVTAPGADLVRQLYEDVRKACPEREVKLIGAGSRTRFPSEDITVCSMDSLDKCDTGRTRLLIVDEPHAAVTNARLPVLNSFKRALRFGFGATLKGRFDNRDALITGLIGPVWAERTYKEAVEEGAICPLNAYMLDIPLHEAELRGNMGSRNRAYSSLLYTSERIGRLVSKICKDILPVSWQTIIFIETERQAEHILDYVGEEGTIAMAKKLSTNERKDLMERMQRDEIKRCIASEIYAQGVTFSDVRAMINCAGGGANTTTIQKPGRLAEIRPDKRCGVVIDFFFHPGEDTDFAKLGSAKMLVIDSRNRLNAYKEKGYEVKVVSTFAELRSLLQKEAM